MKHRRAKGTGSVYQPPRSPFYWIAYYQNGRLFRESAKTESKQKAQDLLTKRLEEVRTNQFNPDTEKITVAAIVKHVFDEYEKSDRPSLGTLKGRWHPNMVQGMTVKAPAPA